MANKSSNEIQQDQLYREVSEEVQQDKIVIFWKKYKNFIFFLIAAVIIATVSIEGYKTWDKNTRLEESNRYEQAAVLNAQGQSEQAKALYETLAGARTDYGFLAQMRIVGILFEEGKTEDALARLNTLRQNPKLPDNLKAIVTLSYVGHMSEKGADAPYNELQSMLSPYLTANSAWYASAAELSALLMIEQGKTDDAEQFLTAVLATPDLPAFSKERLQILLNAVEK